MSMITARRVRPLAILLVGALVLVACTVMRTLEVTVEGEGTVEVTKVSHPKDGEGEGGAVGENQGEGGTWEFESNTTLTLHAIPDAGWEFAGWSGDIEGTDNPIQHTIHGDRQVTATFVPLPSPTWTLDVDVEGVGSVSTDPNPDPDGTYPDGTTVELLAVAGDGWSFTGWAGDLGGDDNPATVLMDGPRSVVATFVEDDLPPPDAAFVSDEFDRAELGPLWEVVDPVGDGSATIVGASHLELAVPAGPSHNPWVPNESLRVVQDAHDMDFRAEVRFDSVPTATFQTQGFLVEQDPGTWLRFDTYRSTTQIRAFAAKIVDGSPTMLADVSVPFVGESLWLEVTRSGDDWVYATSTDGIAFTTKATFTQALTVNAVGPFAGNYSATGDAAAYTARVAYVRETSDAAPSPTYALTTAVVGDGTITRDPAAAAYPAGTAVTLTAVPAPGAAFVGWSGDASGTDNPVVVVMDGDRSVNATFDDAPPDDDPPTVSDVAVAANASSATVSWTTDEPATSLVEFGLDAGYGETASIAGYRTSHAVQLLPLACDQTYHFRIVTEDAAGNETVTDDATFATASCPSGGAAITSDDFVGALDGDRWTLVDPLGDAGVGTTGTQAAIHVPGGKAHNLWTGYNSVPWLRQAATDTDFEVEVKFDSTVELATQIQGLIVAQDAQNLVRFDTSHDGTTAKIFAATFSGGTPTVRLDQTLGGASPAYLRVARSGNTWTLRHSADGVAWTQAASFSHALTVTGIGPFGGNGNPVAHQIPAHVVLVDHVHDLSAPGSGSGPPPAGTPPTIDVWYGSTQAAGHLGTPQQWLNVLGNVSDGDGVADIRYSLNGGPSLRLNRGPDGLRLEHPGDFVVEIDRANLVSGANTVQFDAMDVLGNRATSTVTVQYTSGVSAALPTTVDWTGATSPLDRVAVVDGKWTVTPGGIRTVEPGYDRLLALGEMDWTDYEVRADVTIHALDSTAPMGSGVGLLTGWQGHTGSAWPRIGHPYSGLGMYLRRHFETNHRLAIVKADGFSLAAVDPSGTTLALDTPYRFALRVESLGDGNAWHGFKVWPAGTSEPAGWTLEAVLPEHPGGALLVAHYADVTFGEIQLLPLDP